MNDAAHQTASLIRSAQFRRGREEGWKKLESLIARVEDDGITSLSADEARELPLLYRSTLSSLSVARGIVLDRNLLAYLENLSLRAYLAVYGPRTSLAKRAVAFLRMGFPRTVRKMRWHLAAALLLLAAGILSGYALVRHDPGYYNSLVPLELAGERVPGATRAQLERVIFDRWPGFVNAFVVFANSLFRHNATIGILCFGFGFVLGLPTAFLLIYNGMVLGAVVALHAEQDLTLDFIAWLSIHGVTEVLAIVLCAAAGFVLAHSVVFPGPRSRLENLARNGRGAAAVAAGAVGLFFVAGILEGGFRQLINNTPGRFTFAALTAALWLHYFARTGGTDSDGDNV